MAKEAAEYPATHDFSRALNEPISLMHALGLDTDARVHPEGHGKEHTMVNQDQWSTGTMLTDEIGECLSG